MASTIGVRLRSLARNWTPPIIASSVRNRGKVPLSIRYETLPDGGTMPYYDERAFSVAATSGSDDLLQHIDSFDVEAEIRKSHAYEVIRFLERSAVPRLGSNATLLDVGCGIGQYGTFLRRPGAPTCVWQYGGVERTPTFCSWAQRLNPDGVFRSSDGGPTLPFDDHSWDIVLSSGTLQYVGPDWEHALREMARVSRRFVLLARVPTTLYAPSARTLQTVSTPTVQYRHAFTTWNRTDLDRACAACGLRLIERDYTTEILAVEGLNEPVVLNALLLAIS